MGTTAWRYERGQWSEASTGWQSDDEWGWREELDRNGFEADPAVRLGDIETDTFAAEAYARTDEGEGWAVVVSVGAGGDVVLVATLPDLVALFKELSPVVEAVQNFSLGATSAEEREYARLRRLGYPHDLADEAAKIFVQETGAEEDEA